MITVSSCHLWPDDLTGHVFESAEGQLVIREGALLSHPILCIGGISDREIAFMLAALQWHAEASCHWLLLASKYDNVYLFESARQRSIRQEPYVYMFHTHYDLPGALIIETRLNPGHIGPTIVLVPMTCAHLHSAIENISVPLEYHQAVCRAARESGLPDDLVGIVMIYVHPIGIEAWVDAVIGHRHQSA